VAIEECAELGGTSAWWRVAERLAEGLRVDEISLVRFVDGGFEVLRLQRRCEVDERFGWWCRRDAVAVRSRFNGATMEGDARAAVVGCLGH
jgi:hypothetical protein